MRSARRHRGTVAVVLFALLVSLSGCNTYRGMGQDIERLGQGMQRGGSAPTAATTTPAPIEPPPKQADDKTYVYPLEGPGAQPSPVAPRKDP
ncbi:MAG: hypothetical protein ACFCUJ_13590 [Thiotrichales bacterium]